MTKLISALTVEPLLNDYPTTFRRRDATLQAHAITNGRSPAEWIDHVTTFTGQAFSGDGLEPSLVFPNGFVSVFPKAPWEFRPEDRRVSAERLFHGGVKKYGNGRGAFFGEARAQIPAAA